MTYQVSAVVYSNLKFSLRCRHCRLRGFLSNGDLLFGDSPPQEPNVRSYTYLGIHAFCSVRMEVFRSRLWLPLKRGYASGIDVMNVFDRNAKRSQRNRAAIAEDAHVYDYLKDEVLI